MQDSLIERLTSEVRRLDISAGVLVDADSMLAKSVAEEYNRPLTPLNMSNDQVNLSLLLHYSDMLVTILLFLTMSGKYCGKILICFTLQNDKNDSKRLF